MSSLDTVEAALAFVEAHGVVLASARGSAPRLTEAIAGESIQGSWWSHARSRRIFAILSGVTDSEQILVCRLIDNKITLVHRRLWAPLVRVAGRFTPEQLTQVHEEHTASGRHVSRAIPFPRWVPREVAERARLLSEDEAARVLRRWLPPSSPNPRASVKGESARPQRSRTNQRTES